VSGRREAEGKALEAELTRLGAEAAFIQADVRRDNEVSNLVDKTVARLGRLDVAVNNAGTESQVGPITDQTAESYAATFDTSDYYGPHTVNQLIREALHPYPPQLRIVTKVGARRGPDKSWPPALWRDELISAVLDNLRNLGVDALDVVNLRVGDVERPKSGSLAEPFTVLAERREQGLIRHLGVSGVSSKQLTQAQSIAPVVCVQNLYNVARREDDELVDRCARGGIAYTPFFPLGGFTPLQSGVLDGVGAPRLPGQLDPRRGRRLDRGLHAPAAGIRAPHRRDPPAGALHTAGGRSRYPEGIVSVGPPRRWGREPEAGPHRAGRGDR
jgi:aryl-alcohol dehydrogenase-like predicted oxidoreductase